MKKKQALMIFWKTQQKVGALVTIRIALTIV